MERGENEIGRMNGLPYEIMRTGMGHLCGYVGVGSKHPLFEVNCCTGTSLLEGIDRLTVHGGITWSNCLDDILGGEIFDEGDIWFFGFDCGHSYDAVEPKYRDPSLPPECYLTGGIVRTVEYVRSECAKLASALVEIAEEFWHRNANQGLAVTGKERQTWVWFGGNWQRV